MNHLHILTLSCVYILSVTWGPFTISAAEIFRNQVDEIHRAVEENRYADVFMKESINPDDVEDLSYVETVLSSQGSPLTISRMEPRGAKSERGVHYSERSWERDIPYVIHSSFSALGQRNTLILKRALRRIMDNICVVYRDVTTIYNASNPNWFTENGYPNNGYILIKVGSGCSATTGYGSGRGPINIYPCFDFVINTHELLHTLAGVHTHQIPSRDNYITINYGDIQSGLQNTYERMDDEDFIDDGFDAASTLLYTEKTWTRNGLPTYSPIRDDTFELDTSVSSDATIFYELSKLYRCNERFCSNAQVDCGEGYHTLYKGVCQCVCPAEYDPTTNCAKLFNQSFSHISWPKAPLAVLAGGPDPTCPEEFSSNPGWFAFEGTRPPRQYLVPDFFPIRNKTLFVPVCAKDGPNPEDVDWESWPPGGSYCIIKPKDVPCGGAFSEFMLSMESVTPVEHNGSLGDISVENKNLTIRMCCRDQEPGDMAIELPNSRPFRFVARGDCPRVKGMREYHGLFQVYTGKVYWTGNVEPEFYSFTSENQIFQCYYLPPVYGCNREIVLDRDTRSVTVTTPGFGRAREPNRRCLYRVKVPNQSRVRITFNTYDLDTQDKLLVKPIYKWQEPHRINNARPPYQYLSEGEYFMMEYWSSWEGVVRQGINFTADVILPEDFCYNVTTKGEDYYGDTSITETYEDCLPWYQTTDCSDFPTEGMTPIWLLNSDNKCRNPGGKLLQPWCYIHKNGTNCRKRYCDVCNFQRPVDLLPECEQLKSEDRYFCKSGIQRTACFKTCGFSQASTNRKTCQPPEVPSDGVMVGPVKSTYLEGERVVITCSSHAVNSNQSEMLCTPTGWTGLRSACYVNDCLNMIMNRYCINAVTDYPTFCSDPRFKSLGEMVCKKACGACKINTKCHEPTSSTYTRTSDNATISVGQTMTFACNEGYYHVSGQLQQVCSPPGTLLGSAPVCQSTPVSVDVNINSVFPRLEKYPAGLGMLLTSSEIRVPFSGTISKWYYYCNKQGVVYFLVYRQTSTSYQYVGSNNVTCQTGWRWSFNVPDQDQIPVQKGDIVGVYSPVKGTIMVSDCNKASEKIVRNPFVEASNMTVLMSVEFSGTKCVIPSVGYRVVPGRSN